MKITKFRFRTIEDYDSLKKSQEEKNDDCKKFFFDGDLYFSDNPVCERKN